MWCWSRPFILNSYIVSKFKLVGFKFFSLNWSVLVESVGTFQLMQNNVLFILSSNKSFVQCKCQWRHLLFSHWPWRSPVLACLLSQILIFLQRLCKCFCCSWWCNLLQIMFFILANQLLCPVVSYLARLRKPWLQFSSKYLQKDTSNMLQQ